jgi:hypothetical protein
LRWICRLSCKEGNGNAAAKPTIRLLGEHFRKLVAVEPTLPIEMEVLLLRMVLKEIERARCGGRQDRRRAGATA